MKVVVGSKNPVKLKATENILNQIYSQVEVQAKHADSEVPDQPIGWKQQLKELLIVLKMCFKRI
jgi:non-canonical (house-cleaning) NTP pyrophosphatase